MHSPLPSDWKKQALYLQEMQQHMYQQWLPPACFYVEFSVLHERRSLLMLF